MKTNFVKGFFLQALLFIWLSQLAIITFAQGDTVMVKYTPDFKFKEGIYLNFNQVKNNSPISGARILANKDYRDDDFFDEVLNKDYISFFDNLGMRQQVQTKNIWGFSRNGVLYININGGFNRVTIVGNICHFVATVTTYNTRYNDPYYNNPYYSPYYNPYSNPYSMGSSSYETSEMRQFILDFNTGKVMDYDYKNLEMILMRDPELHDEFSNLRKRKKKQLKFLYIRKFNERNPLYLPVKE